MNIAEAVEYLKSLGPAREGRISISYWNLSKHSGYDVWVRLTYTAEEQILYDKYANKIMEETKDVKPYMTGKVYEKKGFKTPEIGISTIIQEVKEDLARGILDFACYDKYLARKERYK